MLNKKQFLIYNYELERRKISLPRFFGFILFRLPVIKRLALEKTRSAGTDVPGMHKYFKTACFKDLSLCLSQNSMGHLDPRIGAFSRNCFTTIMESDFGVAFSYLNHFKIQKTQQTTGGFNSLFMFLQSGVFFCTFTISFNI